MKKLRKNLTVGKYAFSLEINKDIAISVFEEVPEMTALLDEAMETNKSKKEEFKFSDYLQLAREQDDEKEERRLKTMRNASEIALKKMYRSVETNKSVDDDFFEEFWKYIDENDAELLMCSTLIEFVMQGFTLGKELKPKVKIVLK